MNVEIGAAIIGVGFIVLVILVWVDAKPWNILVFGLLTKLLGATVANLTKVTSLLVSLGGGNSFQIQRAVEHVDNQVAEVQAVRDDLRKAMRALIFTTDYLETISQRYNPNDQNFKLYVQALGNLFVFAYPDPKERAEAASRLPSGGVFVLPSVPQPNK